ncbi:MAG TPA: hypothetical protein PLQ87_03830, partial [Phycisphaerae bacterium]|nr:hypothetical protein [Phycisphaerae bacterium]
MPTITHNHTSNTRHNPLWRRGLHGATCIATVISTTFIPAAAADVTIQQIGQWGGPSYAIDICGTTAYVGVGHTLGIFDVSTPDAPYFVGRSAELLDLVRGVRVSGNYAYVAIAQEYMGHNGLVMGMTASPGSSMAKIKEVCTNLGIENIEVRSE